MHTQTSHIMFRIYSMTSCQAATTSNWCKNGIKGERNCKLRDYFDLNEFNFLELNNWKTRDDVYGWSCYGLKIIKVFFNSYKLKKKKINCSLLCFVNGWRPLDPSWRKAAPGQCCWEWWSLEDGPQWETRDHWRALVSSPLLGQNTWHS